MSKQLMASTLRLSMRKAALSSPSAPCTATRLLSQHVQAGDGPQGGPKVVATVAGVGGRRQQHNRPRAATEPSALDHDLTALKVMQVPSMLGTPHNHGTPNGGGLKEQRGQGMRGPNGETGGKQQQKWSDNVNGKGTNGWTSMATKEHRQRPSEQEANKQLSATNHQGYRNHKSKHRKPQQNQPSSSQAAAVVRPEVQQPAPPPPASSSKGMMSAGGWADLAAQDVKPSPPLSPPKVNGSASQQQQRGEGFMYNRGGGGGNTRAAMDQGFYEKYSHIMPRTTTTTTTTTTTPQHQQHHHHQHKHQQNQHKKQRHPGQAVPAAVVNGSAAAAVVNGSAAASNGAMSSRVSAMETPPVATPQADAGVSGGAFWLAELLMPGGSSDSIPRQQQHQQQGHHVQPASSPKEQMWKQRGKPRSGGGMNNHKRRVRMSKEDERKHAIWRAKTKHLRKLPLVLPLGPISVRDLSRKLAMKMEIMIPRLVNLGEPPDLKPDSMVDADTAELLGLELRLNVTRDFRSASSRQDALLEYSVKSETKGRAADFPLRAPVVCVMGHVDHGKTTLLDSLRKTKVAAGEAGGITQKLGAFHLDSFHHHHHQQQEQEGEEEATGSAGRRGVTFLDTPGHAAFSTMRLNGANATDIVLLVVSAIDGVQQQTEEVLRLVSKEQCTVMVAVTKVDKLGSGGDEEEVKAAMGRIERQLAEHGIMTESLGGDVQMVPVSAVTGKGLGDLVERLSLQAEIMELRADSQGPAEGVVLDCSVEKGLGTVVNVLVRWGSLKPGACVVAGQQYGRVRKLLDASGKAMEAAIPSMPVRVLGLKDLPAPGDEVVVVPDEDRAKRIVEARRAAAERDALEAAEAVEVLDDEDVEQLKELMAEVLANSNNPSAKSNKTKAFLALQQAAAARNDSSKRGQVVVPILVKADGKGLLDALTASLAAYESDTIRAEVIQAGCGAITDGDLELAKAAGDTIVLGFGVGFANVEVQEMARREKLLVHRHKVIYSLLDDVKAALQDRMPMERIEKNEGRLEVQQIFALSGRRRTKNEVAGCRVVHGTAFGGPAYRYRVIRNGEVVCRESPPSSLYHFKEIVQEVAKGMECGLSLEGFGAFQPGDVVECYTVTEQRKGIKDIFPFCSASS